MAEVLQSTEQVEESLRNPSFSVYVYIGDEDDAGWEIAEILFGLLARLRVYCAVDATLVEEWTGGDDTIVGLVFGWDETLERTLDMDEAEDLRVTLDAIRAARGEE